MSAQQDTNNQPSLPQEGFVELDDEQLEGVSGGGLGGFLGGLFVVWRFGEVGGGGGGSSNSAEG